MIPVLKQSSAANECPVSKTFVDCDHRYWGDGDSNAIADPNLRLQLLIEAARRGAKVRLLLDSFFDDPEANRSNHATVEYLAAVAAAERLDIAGAVGSLNGGEISHKVNREVVLMVDHPLVYERLLEVFLHDWASVTR